MQVKNQEHKLMSPSNAQFGQHADLGIVKTLHDNPVWAECWYVSIYHGLITYRLGCMLTLTSPYFMMYILANILMTSQSCSFILQCGQYTDVIPKLLIHTAVWPVYWCHPKVAHSYCSVASILMSSQSCSFILQCGQYTDVILKLLIHTAVWPVYWCHFKVAHSYCSVASILMFPKVAHSYCSVASILMSF